MTLTPQEQKLIEAHRREVAEKDRKLALCYACIDELKRWKDWSLEHGQGLTYSTFVNDFCEGLAHPSGFGHKEIYEAIKVMITALDELHG